MFYFVGLYCSVCWSEVCWVCCRCVGIWQCHEQLHLGPSCEICEEIYIVFGCSGSVSIFMSVSDILQESGELSSCIFSLLWIWTLRRDLKDWNIM